jgi:peroxiredoxin Q/BCP
MIIANNSAAPDFNLADQEGKMHSLSEYKGNMVLLYFYPKDDTPGCTVEACSFRDDYSQYKKSGVVILGVSPDSVKSHAKFAAKYHLPFPILADEDHAVCEKYGVWGRKKMMGREHDGVFRTTFLIGPDGMVKKIYEGVKPAEHSAEILKDIAGTAI